MSRQLDYWRGSLNVSSLTYILLRGKWIHIIMYTIYIYESFPEKIIFLYAADLCIITRTSTDFARQNYYYWVFIIIIIMIHTHTLRTYIIIGGGNCSKWCCSLTFSAFENLQVRSRADHAGGCRYIIRRCATDLT